MIDPKRAPRTPLLMVMLLAAAVIATAAWATADMETHLRVIEPIVVAAMVTAAGATRMFAR